MSHYFPTVTKPIAFEGAQSTNPLAFKWYDKDRMVLGKRMEEHLRFAVCYWHTFCWNGLDPFGGDTFQRPWQLMADPMAGAKAKADVAFEFFAKLGVPYYCFHDRDIAPEGATPRDSVNNFREYHFGAICALLQRLVEVADSGAGVIATNRNVLQFVGCVDAKNGAGSVCACPVFQLEVTHLLFGIGGPQR